MDYLKTASFGALFGAAFTVGAAFHIAMSLLGLLVAVLSPGLFNMNGVPATNALQAVGVLLFLLVMMLIVNAAISAVGSGVWLLARRLILRQPAESKA